MPELAGQHKSDLLVAFMCGKDIPRNPSDADSPANNRVGVCPQEVAS